MFRKPNECANKMREQYGTKKAIEVAIAYAMNHRFDHIDFGRYEESTTEKYWKRVAEILRNNDSPQE